MSIQCKSDTGGIYVSQWYVSSILLISPQSKAVFLCHPSSISHHRIVISFCYKSISHHLDVQLKIQDDKVKVRLCTPRLSKKILQFLQLPITPSPTPFPSSKSTHLSTPQILCWMDPSEFLFLLIAHFSPPASYIHWSNRIFLFSRDQAGLFVKKYSPFLVILSESMLFPLFAF